jgi:hypothetical protein
LVTAFHRPRVRPTLSAVTTHGDIELGRLARGRAGIFTKEDAATAGVPKREVKARLRSGLWIAEGSALRAATTPETMATREQAALVHLGPVAALSHLSAARRWRFDAPAASEVWVTVPWRRQPISVPGLRVVRSRHLPPAAVRRLDSVRVVTPARTVADLALHLDERPLTAIALSAMQRQLCTYEELVYWQQVLAGRPGTAVLRRALEEADPAFESILSAEFGRLVADEGLVPCLEVRLSDGGRVLCDFGHRTARIDFEADGAAYHSGPAQMDRDRARDRRMLRNGWITVRYGTDDIRRHPRETLADVRRQIALRLP